MAPKRKRKAAPKRKKRATARRARGTKIPLLVLKRRLARLRKIVGEREVESQASLWK